MSQVATQTVAVVHAKDPKKVINDALKGLIDRIQPTSGDCVVCVYERPQEIALGNGKKLYTPDNYSRTSEDKFQGVVGLIVKTGPEFAKHKKALGLEEMPKVGDWVAFRTQDCVSFVLGARAMRLLQGDFIRLVLQDPDVII